MGKSLTADRRLYLTADRNTIAEEGAGEARFLLAGKGGPIDGAEAERLGLRLDEGGRVVQGGPEVKEQPKPEDKQRAKPATKKVAKKKAKKRGGK